MAKRKIGYAPWRAAAIAVQDSSNPTKHANFSVFPDCRDQLRKCFANPNGIHALPEQHRRHLRNAVRHANPEIETYRDVEQFIHEVIEATRDIRKTPTSLRKRITKFFFRMAELPWNNTEHKASRETHEHA